MGKIGEEEGHAHHGVPAGVYGRIDDPTIALASDDGALLAHEGGDIDLADCRCVILSAVSLGDVAERPGRREVGNSHEISDALGLSAFQDIVRNAYEGVFLHEWFPVLADQGEAVHIRVD